jgi:hypothetical protein
MASYGRNIEFRVPPVHGQRGGRYAAPAGVDLPMGVPVKVADGAAETALGLLPVALATGAQAPKVGTCGIAIYEYNSGIDLGGVDPVLTTYSDRDTIPRGRAIQVISGDRVKVVFTNTEDRTFLTARNYEGRVMVAGMGATPTLQVGDFLTPGTGDDTAGYWAEGTAANAWMVVERIDVARQEVEARFVF